MPHFLRPLHPLRRRTTLQQYVVGSTILAILGIVHYLPQKLCSQQMLSHHARSHQTSSPSKTNSLHSLYEPLGNCIQWQRDANGLSLTTPTGLLRLVVYSPTIVRVRIAKEGRFDDHSFAVIATPQPAAFTISETADALTLNTDSLTVRITKSPVRLQFLTKQGKLINQDDPAFGTGWQGNEVTAYKTLLPDEKFLGLGEKTGNLNRRGEAFTNWNTDAFGYGGRTDPLYGSHPFYIGVHSIRTTPSRSSAQATTTDGILYGIFFDNCHRTHFNFGASNDRFSSFSADDGEMNYYFIHRSTMAELLADYTLLTGRMELPPLWSLGYHQCRYSYFPDKEVLSVAKTIREKQIPADVLWLDIHYMDAYKVFTWHPERFPKPKALLSELKTLGFKTVVIIDPGVKVEKGYAAYEDGLRKDVFLKYPDGTLYKGEVWPGWCHFPDFTKPATRSWWGDKFKSLIDDGLDGFWNDMNEPATWGQRFPDLVEFDFDGNKATHKKGHNVFGMQMARATFEGVKHHSGKRPFVLTRASYAGIQRYAAVWTGDNTASDEHILLGARLLNTMGLAGIPFTGVDVGGFNGNGSRELFARWVSVGALSPFFRVHAAINTKEQDPWSFGEDVEELCRAYIGLRYRLLPYIYSTFYESTQTGLPVARSLALYAPFDEKIYDSRYQSQYLFGQSILVAPVASTQEFVKIYLPAGAWYDAYTDRLIEGNQELLVESPLERLPVFIKAGAVLPMQSLVQHTGQSSDGKLYVHVYQHAAQSAKSQTTKLAERFTHYEDDGQTLAYQQKDFAKREICFESSQKRLIFGKIDGKRASAYSSIVVVFHGFEQMPTECTVNGKKVALGQHTSPFLQQPPAHDPLNVPAAGVQPYLSRPSVTIPNSSQEIILRW